MSESWDMSGGFRGALERAEKLLGERDAEIARLRVKLGEVIGIRMGLRERCSWRGIEGAPRDGSTILVWGKGFDEPQMWYTTGAPEYVGPEVAGFTHWMALPGGPESELGEKDE